MGGQGNNKPMMADRNRLLLVLSGALVLVDSGCFLMNLRPQLDVSDYHGDGTISQIHSAENPGFKVDFVSFSLGAPHTSRYRLEGMPRAHGITPYEAGVVVKLTTEEESHWPSMPEEFVGASLGTLKIRLEDSSGTRMFEGTADVGGLSWMRFSGDLPFGTTRVWRYQPADHSEPRRQPWLLEVSYLPGARAIEREVGVRFAAGGMH